MAGCKVEEQRLECRLARMQVTGVQVTEMWMAEARMLKCGWLRRG
jgi:hypothetical protein